MSADWGWRPPKISLIYAPASRGEQFHVEISLRAIVLSICTFGKVGSIGKIFCFDLILSMHFAISIRHLKIMHVYSTSLVAIMRVEFGLYNLDLGLLIVFQLLT